jgi:hypothetical protein
VSTAWAEEGHEKPGCSGKAQFFHVSKLFIISCESCLHEQFLQSLVRHSPDAYLDEMQELLETRRGTNVGKPTIWRALIRSGFTMKKASSFKFFDFLCLDIKTYIETSSPGMHWSQARPSKLFTAINMAPGLLQSKLFLSMKAPSIAELPFVERHGHYQGKVQ